jgi:hypothetical protein
MPGGDRTGPRGEGSRTGRAAGYCSGNDSPGYANPMVGYGGRGMRGGAGGGIRGGMGGMMGGGRGRGYRHIYYATGLPRWMRGGGYPAVQNDTALAADDIGSLKREADLLEERLKSIIERIRSIEPDSGKDND